MSASCCGQFRKGVDIHATYSAYRHYSNALPTCLLVPARGLSTTSISRLCGQLHLLHRICRCGSIIYSDGVQPVAWVTTAPCNVIQYIGARSKDYPIAACISPTACAVQHRGSNRSDTIVQCFTAEAFCRRPPRNETDLPSSHVLVGASARRSMTVRSMTDRSEALNVRRRQLPALLNDSPPTSNRRALQQYWTSPGVWLTSARARVGG
jgi:hypothetical protein